MRVSVHYRGGGVDHPVGILESDGRRIFFQYDPAWLGRGLELSPFTLPLADPQARAPRDERMHGLFGLFADSLPDWWGERLMQRYFQSLGKLWRDVGILDRLCCQGERTMGALCYEPDLRSGGTEDSGPVDLSRLAEAALAALQGETGTVLERLLRSGQSAGGAQPKVVLGLSSDGAEVRSGEGELPEGFDHWLVKFDLAPELEDGRAEVVCGLAAQAAGIEMPEVRLLEDAEGRGHFAVRRFDRRDHNLRVHVQTYAALAQKPVSEMIDYDDLLAVTRELTRDRTQVEQLFRRAAFNVCLGNDDDHGKNHSFLMEFDGEWRLAPAYDVMQHGFPLGGGMRACAVLGRSVTVGRGDLLDLARNHSVRNAEAILDEVQDALARLDEFAATIPISRHRIDELRRGIRVL